MSSSFGLLPQTSNAVPTSLQLFTSSTEPLTWTVTQNGQIVDSGVITNPTSGLNTASTNLPAGSYTLTTSQGGTEAGSQDFTVPIYASSSTVSAQLVANADAGTSLVPPQLDLSDALKYGLNNSTTVQTPEAEFLYPNDSYNKYFTATQARIYIGNLFIDEVDTIQFVLQDNISPIFGYSSRYLDAYGQGRSLVQGQLAINFVTEGYLYTVLKEYRDNYGGFGNTSSVQDQIQSLTAAKLNLSSNPSPTSSDTNALNYINQQLSQLVANTGPSAVQYMRSTLQTSREAPSGYRVNAVYQPVLFDIEVDFGEGPTLRVRRLEKCKLISNEMIVDQSGKHLLDAYGFIARRLR